MREKFFTILMELAESDKDIIVLTNDVGYSFIDSFANKFPKQVINCGIMEQSLTGIAAGLAVAGKKPYIYSMRNFVVFRPFEQVRNDIAFENVNVKFLGVSGSESYKFLGSSHNVYSGDDGLYEDMRMMKNLPNMNCYESKDKEELKKQLMFEYKRKGPAYFIL